MTKIQIYKVAGSVLVLVIGFLLDRKARAASSPPGTGEVELGIPTVTGSGAETLGNQGYYSPRPAIAPTSGALADDPEMDRLIRESNAAIAAFDAENGN